MFIFQNLVSRLNALQPLIAEDSMMRRTLDTLIGQLYNYATTGGYLQPSHRAKYTCEFNITQYGEQSSSPLVNDDTINIRDIKEESRRESVKDILNLGFTATMESDVAPTLPTDRAGIIK